MDKQKAEWIRQYLDYLENERVLKQFQEYYRTNGYHKIQPVVTTRKRKTHLIPLAAGVTSLLLGFGVLIQPAYAEPLAELPEIPGMDVQADTSAVKAHVHVDRPSHHKEKQKGHHQSQDKPALPEQPEQPELNTPTIPSDQSESKPHNEQSEPQKQEHSPKHENHAVFEPKENPSADVPQEKSRPESHTEKREPVESSKPAKSVVSKPQTQPAQEPAELPDRSVAVGPTDTNTSNTPRAEKPPQAVSESPETTMEQKSVASTQPTQKNESVTKTQSAPLPKTASNNPNGLLAGLLFLFGGSMLHLHSRMRKRWIEQ